MQRIELIRAVWSESYEVPRSGPEHDGYRNFFGFPPAYDDVMPYVFVYLGMAALGLALEAMITILTPKFVPFFLFILVRIRLSSVFPC